MAERLRLAPVTVDDDTGSVGPTTKAVAQPSLPYEPYLLFRSFLSICFLLSILLFRVHAGPYFFWLLCHREASHQCSQPLLALPEGRAPPGGSTDFSPCLSGPSSSPPLSPKLAPQTRHASAPVAADGCHDHVYPYLAPSPSKVGAQPTSPDIAACVGACYNLRW